MKKFAIFSLARTRGFLNAIVYNQLSFYSMLFALPGFVLPVHGQDYSGYRSTDYSGVNGVFFNPANISDSRYRYDVNLFSLSTSVGNNQISFNLGEVTSAQNNSKFLGSSAGPSSGL